MKPGHFKLYDSAVPKLRAGEYDLVGNYVPWASQEEKKEVAPDQATEELRSRIRVRSPRYRLPPEQILSVWPAANEEGSFEGRLPQIAIRRRTLPWERDPGKGAKETTPWLALVVIAEGEGMISDETPVAECVTPGVDLGGDGDAPSGVFLGVTKKVIDKVFPTLDDLVYLTHIREVDLADTELALGDDDGFLAVVLANRLPQFDRVTGRPVRYMACLINLEQQLGALPKATAPSPTFDTRLDDLLIEIGFRPGAVAPKLEAATVTRRIEDVALKSSPDRLAAAVRAEMKGNFRIPLELIAEKVFRFPVLAHWSFTCTGEGSFETLMQNLDVGLLGTAPAEPAGEDGDRPRPPAPPPPPEPRPAPEFAETGHIGLGHRSRRGERLRAWYRGPLVPHPTERDLSDEERNGNELALAHVSDQLRRVIADGREELGYAAAFEIGRLLTLARPLVVATLMRWRGEHFGAERARRKAKLSVEDLPAQAKLELGADADLGQALGRGLLLRAAADPAAILGPSRPPVDPGRPVDAIDRPLDRILADGFEIPAEKIRLLMKEPLTGPGPGEIGRLGPLLRGPVRPGGLGG